MTIFSFYLGLDWYKIWVGKSNGKILSNQYVKNYQNGHNILSFTRENLSKCS